MGRPKKPLYEYEADKIVKILSDPVLWGEFYFKNRNSTKRQYWQHQKDDLRCNDKYIIHLDGRETGKSVSLITHVLHYSFITQGGSVLVAAPYMGQLDVLIDEMEFQIDNNNELYSSIAVNRNNHLKLIRKPYYRIEFTNGSVIHFRPAGPHGESFRSLHVQRLYVDEGAWIPERAWKALRMCLLPDGKMRIYSTPNGLRDTTYYRLTKSEGWKVFRWPSWISPLWTEARKHELLAFYGGKDSPGWHHEVAGEHGKPSFGAFNLEQLVRCLQDIPNYTRIYITGEEFTNCENEEEIRQRIDLLLNLSQHEGLYYLGGDLGYTSDPTELVLFQEVDDKLKMILRIHAEHVAYPVISELIATIDKAYNPVAIGIDNGGNGVSVIQELTSLDKFKINDFSDRLFGFDFGGTTVIGYDGDKLIKKRTKEHMTALINSALARRLVEFPAEDQEIEDQFSTQTYHIGERHIVYSNGNDSYCTFL